MKKLILILTMFVLFVQTQAQIITCRDDSEHLYPTITPNASAVAIPTKGWIYENSKSIEFDTIPYNNWYLLNNFDHGNVDSYFSSDTAFWDLDNGTIKLYLDSVPNGGFNYTSATVKNNMLNGTYGYYECKMKMPKDENLCVSFWGIEGASGSNGYREIDINEYFGYKMLSNIYHYNANYGTVKRIDTSLFSPSNWYVFGYEWLPNTYSLYINNHHILTVDYTKGDCVLDSIANINYWWLWLVKWNGAQNPTGPFPKTLEADYIRIYSLKTDSINNDFYDNWSNYDYGVWRTVKLGDAYSTDAKIDGGSHSVWATDEITLDAGFEVTLGTEFETKIYKK